jgi:hypothetical protein
VLQTHRPAFASRKGRLIARHNTNKHDGTQERVPPGRAPLPNARKPSSTHKIVRAFPLSSATTSTARTRSQYRCLVLRAHGRRELDCASASSGRVATSSMHRSACSALQTSPHTACSLRCRWKCQGQHETVGTRHSDAQCRPVLGLETMHLDQIFLDNLVLQVPLAVSALPLMRNRTQHRRYQQA